MPILERHERDEPHESSADRDAVARRSEFRADGDLVCEHTDKGALGIVRQQAAADEAARTCSRR